MKEALLVVLAFSGCAPTQSSLIHSGRMPPTRVTTKSELLLTCTPADAEVVLDDVPQGTCEDFGGTPRGLFLGNGVRRVQVRKAGHLPWNTVIASDNTRVVLEVTLLPSSGAGP